MNEKLEDIRCIKCRRKLLKRDSLTTVGYISVHCKRCKSIQEFFIFKNKSFPINASFKEHWNNHLKKEFDDYIMNMSTE